MRLRGVLQDIAGVVGPSKRRATAASGDLEFRGRNPATYHFTRATRSENVVVRLPRPLGPEPLRHLD